MKKSARPARSFASRVVTLALSCALLLGPLASTMAYARVKQKTKKPTPARIEVSQKDPSAVLRPGSGVVFEAKVFDKNGNPYSGGEIKWSTTGSDAVGLGQAVDDGAKHVVTLIGFSPDGRPANSATVSVTGKLGTLSHTVSIDFRANVSLSVERSADAPAKLTPGETYTLSATVKDGDQEIPNAEVKWAPADPGDRDFVLPVHDPQKKNTINVIGRKPPKGKTVPDKVVIAATYGGAIRLVTIPYGDGSKADDTEKPKPETAKVGDIIVTRTGSPVPSPCASPAPAPTLASPFDPEPDYDIESGRRLSLTASVVKEDCSDTKNTPEAVWSVPKEMNKYVAMLPQSDDDKKNGRAVFFGLTPESGDAEPVRESLYVLVQAKNVTKAVPIRNGEQTVDVSWIILPPDVVTKNFGRGVSDKYYGVEVVIGNNSGNDLQLTGLSFEVDSSLLQGQSNALRRMPVASYNAVRGMTEQKKLSFKSRGTILSGLDAAAQILTGFTPFFHVAARARNFSQGVNILSNPVTKGIERVWPDPQADEMSRLEQQSLHDDKIIPNDSVYRTTVFFPKDVLTGTPSSSGANLNENDLTVIRQKLGQLILVGSKLNRNDFQMRVRRGNVQPAGARIGANK